MKNKPGRIRVTAAEKKFASTSIDLYGNRADGRGYAEICFSLFHLIRANLLLGSLILYRGKDSNWMRQRYWELFKSCSEAVESQTYEADVAALE